MTATTTDAWVPALDVDSINGDLDPSRPTVNVAMYYPNNLDPGHSAKVTIDLLIAGFTAAKPIFLEAGVQLKLLWLKTGYLDPALFAVNSTKPESELPSGRFANIYVEAERRPAAISDEALAAFTAIIGEVPDSDRIVHLITLQDVFMDFYEQLDFRTWQLKTISTGGLSFPGYMFGNTMPDPLRGVITITDLTKESSSWKTIAHELGHKLLNVSHEYRETSPQHEVRADGGLMLYGTGTEILSGPEGRYHYERLHRSPYLYTAAPDGTRHYNRDYERGGFYYDPIYDGVSVDLDAEATKSAGTA
jgi:hypothetical protein